MVLFSPLGDRVLAKPMKYALFLPLQDRFVFLLHDSTVFTLVTGLFGLLFFHWSQQFSFLSADYAVSCLRFWV